MKRHRTWIASSLAACALIALASNAGHSAIRVDGTEFQAVAAVAENNAADANGLAYTMGQALVAQGTQPGAPDQYQIGIGYEYNVGGTSELACHCPSQGDMDGSGGVDAVDLAGLIDAIFFGATDPRDWTCQTTRADIDANGSPDAVDLALQIDHIFFGGVQAADPCAP